MKTSLFFLCSFFLCLLSTAYEINLFDQEGRRLPDSQKNNLQFSLEELRHNDGTETILYQLTGTDDKQQFVQIRCDVTLRGNDLHVFDGVRQLPQKTSEHQARLLYLGSMPLVAAWNAQDGMAIAAGAEDHHSFLHMEMHSLDDGLRLSLTANAALLSARSTYEGKFHVIRFSGKYGECDAFSRYYKLYPKRFKPNPEVDQRVYGLSATYASWMRSNPEWTRFAGSEWEWCLAAGRHWGDLSGDYYALSHQPYIEPYYFSQRSGKWDPKNLDGLPEHEFRRIQKQRLSDGYYCGVANAFYTTGASRIHHDLAPKFNDSRAASNPRVLDHYDNASSVFAFPEGSWFKELMRMITLVIQRDDVTAMAFDIPLESEVYRGELLEQMTNVGFDEYGAGVARAVANSKLYQAINTLRSKHEGYQVAVVKNANAMHQVNDNFYADCIMVEANPWQYAPPWPRAARYVMGEKAVTFWEGYHCEDFDANFKFWPQEAKDELIRDLSRYAAHRAFLYGIGLGAHFCNEYLSRLAPALRACLKAGYKVMPGVQTQDSGLTLSRYGNAEYSLIAVCNKSKSVANPKIEVFAGELSSDLAGTQPSQRLLFSGFLGGEVMNFYTCGQQLVSCEVLPLRLNILEAVGSLPLAGEGQIRAEWVAGFSNMVLRLCSVGYSGSVKLRHEFGVYRLAGDAEINLEDGQRRDISYVNSLTHISESQIKNLNLDLETVNFHIRHSPSSWSKDMAERIAVFFREMAQLQIRLEEDKGMPEFSVLIASNKETPGLRASSIVGNHGNIGVAAKDRLELSKLTIFLLDALNAIKYPNYTYGVKMNQEDGLLFKTQRYNCSF